MTLQPRQVQLPPDLAAFLAEVSGLIESGDETAMIESDDLLQCDSAYGGRNEEGGDVWGFTYFPDMSDHKWELAFTREQLRDIAAGRLTTATLWFCTREGCRSAFPSDDWECPHWGVRDRFRK